MDETKLRGEREPASASAHTNTTASCNARKAVLALRYAANDDR